jgi:3',5'-cyclic AMP phosphodiesterase CpdA
VTVLAHISDVHLGPLPRARWRELASKRALGYFNWHRNRARLFDDLVLSAITDDIRANRPDHIAVTGDLVNIGLDAEYDTALDWLHSLGEPYDVTVVPGNHDAYVRRAVARYSAAWLPFASGDDPHPEMMFPFLRCRGRLALIGVSSAVATAPLMATGRIEEDQAQKLGQLLAATGREGLARVVLIHHPPVSARSHWFRRLVGADLVRHAVGRFGAELVLHGHDHHTSIGWLPGPSGREIPVVGAASPSIVPNDRHPGGAYNLLRIEGEPDAWAIGMVERGYRNGRIETVSSHRLDRQADQPTATQA